MPPTLQQVKSTWKESSPERTTSRDMALEMIKTAAVSFDHLTNDPHWDRFLSILQEKLEVARKERHTWLENCGLMSDDTHLRNAQFQYHRLDSEVKVLEKIIGLPIQLRQSYDALRKA